MAFLAVIAVGAILYLGVRSIYRLYFHPLSHIPGPKLAAITSGYEFYHNIFRGGLFVWEVKRLHEIYGPIIRMNPREVHIMDPDYYDEIYAGASRKREKDPVLVAQFGLSGSGFSSIDAESHRVRRAPADKFFSKRAIENSEWLIYKGIDKFYYYLEEACKSHIVISLDAGFAALTSDTIYQYVYDFNPGSLDKEGFNASVRDGINGLFRGAHLIYFFPVLQTIMNALPVRVLETINHPAAALAKQKRDLYLRGETALKNAEVSGRSGLSGPKKNDNLINTLASTAMPQELRTAERLMNEGFAFIIGGTETTARTLSVGAWHLYSKSHIRNKLREELKTVMPTPNSRPRWNELEKLPYLSGVVHESLRLSTGIANRSARVAPTEALIYNGYTIPPGTPVSETHCLILMDPEIFPNPHEFDPERWQRAAAKGQRLEKYLVNFSKGTRMCVGLNLAWAELFLVIATLVRRFEIEIYETPEENIEFARDFGTPWPDKGGLSVQAVVKGTITD
ncbi:cytochrome P450 [Aspergillus karnatakaensis]|uniref:cytochrome P450 n=1 Tax=Aspergillus karnatakaensis TaxID=1810916 RepID=UPI003CCE0157